MHILAFLWDYGFPVLVIAGAAGLLVQATTARDGASPLSWPSGLVMLIAGLDAAFGVNRPPFERVWKGAAALLSAAALAVHRWNRRCSTGRMAELADLVDRWQRGWCVARSVGPGTSVGGGVRVHCRQRGREVEYFAHDRADLERLAKLVLAEEPVTWLTVATTEPDRVAAVLEDAGLILLKRSEKLMTIDLREQPRGEPPSPYRVETRVEDKAVTVEVLDGTGQVGASGTAGLSGTDAVADRIATDPAHRRRGLASAVMSALAGAALEHGAETGILVASDDGQRLYTALGWRPVADVVIAAAPGTVYPD